MDSNGVIDALWTGELKCIGPKAWDADLWITIWEEVHNRRSKIGTSHGGGEAAYVSL